MRSAVLTIAAWSAAAVVGTAVLTTVIMVCVTVAMHTAKFLVSLGLTTL